MSSSSRQFRLEGGFTLLEILMAIAIFALVIAMAYGSYNATFSIINGAGAQSELYTKARTAMERIMEDLEGFYPAEQLVFEGTSESMGGYRRDSLRFTSTAHVRLHPDQNVSGYTVISYQTREEPETGTLSLYRSEQPGYMADTEEEEEAPELLLCDNLREVAFDYQDKEGQDQESWEDTGEISTTPNLPRRITVTLRFADDTEGNGTGGTMFQTALGLQAVERRR